MRGIYSQVDTLFKNLHLLSLLLEKKSRDQRDQVAIITLKAITSWLNVMNICFTDEDVNVPIVDNTTPFLSSNATNKIRLHNQVCTYISNTTDAI